MTVSHDEVLVRLRGTDTVSGPRTGRRRPPLVPSLLIGGAALLPLGLLVIVLGWYGIANTPYIYDQNAYLVSGGLLGLAITVAGAVLFSSALFTRNATERREQGRRLEALLTELVEQGRGAWRVSAATTRLVTTPTGHTAHVAECGLLNGRTDLIDVTGSTSGLRPCRVCDPDLPQT